MPYLMRISYEVELIINSHTATIQVEGGMETLTKNNNGCVASLRSQSN
ncbi:hypothetical protein T02_8041 [Trichinella nativa]|uniref:Uncharacterized protein n=1 Tax=Trichinella nativa TaxID=6335 RepID=A0A0V1KK54_9BILA|nr:hypothetical protein T02_8041 [Trichinella nativa]